MAENIVELLTDVADAIREKKGSTEKINAQAFAEEIKNLPSGGNAALRGTLIDDTGLGIANSLHIIVAEGVTSIGTKAYYLTSLESIEMPNTITSIGLSAFFQTKLIELNLPDSIYAIPNELAQNCSQLQRIKLPSQMQQIGAYAFKNCTSLAKIDIPSTTFKIDNQAFYGCSSLRTIVVRTEAFPTLSNSAFTGIAADALIYVPDESVDAYKSATNWSAYADAIRPISELPNE